MSGAVTVLAAWLLTYLVHSTLLLGGVALATAYVVKRESLRETLWKAALVGGLVTATVAVALPRPGAFRVEMAALSPVVEEAEAGAGMEAAGEPVAPVESTARPAESVGPAGPIDTGPVGPPRGQGARAGASSMADEPSAASGVAETGANPGGAGGAAGRWIVAGLALWATFAALLLFRLAYRHARLRWLLRDRAQVPGTVEAASVLTELRRTAGVWRPVRLTSSPSVATPLALGAVEVCVPERFLTELGPAEQRAALAHELAHLARRDPFWQLAGSVIGAAFFFQPLNLMARKGIRSAAEYLADGWAVAHTGSQMELARCLAAVAGWVAPSSEPALAGTVAMAEGGSPLLARVQRLLEHEPESTARPAARVAAAVLLVAVAAGFAPAVGPAEAARSAPPPAGPAAQSEAAAERDTDVDTDTWAEGDVAESEDGVAPAVDASQEPLDVRMFDRPGVEGDGFVARLNEAGRDAGQAPYWVAYAVSSVEGARRVVVDTEGWRATELRGRPLASVLGLESELAGAGPYPVLVLARLVPQGQATRVDRLTMRRPDVGMRLSGTVYWLGFPEAEESFRWLRDIQLAAWSADVREAAVEGIALHDTPSAVPFLRRVLENDEEPNVREEALEGLALRRQDPELARLLFEVALNDPQGGVRHEATEQLGRMESEVAVPLLERLAAESQDAGVQRQAAESLGGVGGEAAEAALRRLVETHPLEDVRREALDQLADTRAGMDGQVLLELALREDDPGLRREAVELMERLPPDAAVSFLRRAAFESGDGTVEAQASESLGKVGTPAALAVLVDILEQNPSEDASFQAVEAVAENFPRDVVVQTLRAVLSTHPSSRVRREAVDRLGDLGG